jgi:hypothetical protein
MAAEVANPPSPAELPPATVATRYDGGTAKTRTVTARDKRRIVTTSERNDENPSGKIIIEDSKKKDKKDLKM